MKNRLVVFFSYTGNTLKIADMIKEKLECDVLRINPVKPYSDDYQSVVDEEEDSNNFNKIIEIEDTNIDLSKYDEIIVGTPVWWYSVTPAVRTFLRKNDLSNKVIVPYATNAGWLGNTFKEIKKLCPNSIIKNEMDIVFESYSDKLVTSIDDINNWIEKL